MHFVLIRDTENRRRMLDGRSLFEDLHPVIMLHSHIFLYLCVYHMNFCLLNLCANILVLVKFGSCSGGFFEGMNFRLLLAAERAQNDVLVQKLRVRRDKTDKGLLLLNILVEGSFSATTTDSSPFLV